MTRKKHTTRRAFLKGTVGVAAAACAAPQIIVHAEENNVSKSPIVGTGTHQYEWIANWAKLPEGRSFGFTHAVQEDSQGRIFVHHTGAESIAVFDPDGNFIKGLGKEWQTHAHGMQLRMEDGQEFLYLAPTLLHKVVKTTLDGEIVLELGYPKESGHYEDETKYVPTNTAIASNGDIYIADGYGKSYIHQYNAKGEFIRSWGGPGAEAGKMNCCHGLWIDTRSGVEELVVADRANARLQYFSLDGQHLRFVTESIHRPCHFDQRGDDLLLPDLYGRVSILDKENKLITDLGNNPGIEKEQGYPDVPEAQRLPGKFISPHAAIWDRAGNIFVTEWISTGRLTKLKRV